MIKKLKKKCKNVFKELKNKYERLFTDLDERYIIPDAIWEIIRAILPIPEKKTKKGAPRTHDYPIITAIFYVMRTGCQWSAIPRCLPPKSTVFDRFQYWVETGLFFHLWQKGVWAYEETQGIQWEYQSMDGAQVQAPLGGTGTGPAYKFRGKTGTTRSLLTDARGIPLALHIGAANINDFKLAEMTLKSFVIERPNTDIIKQHMCLDKGYDYPEIDILVASYHYIEHIQRKGESINQIEIPHLYKPKRWVVERTHAWMNSFRRVMTRWERKSENYFAFLAFSCAWISFRAAGVIDPFE